MENREKEMKQKEKYHEGWKISKKYSTILMDHEDKNEYFEIAPNIYHQFISELKVKKVPHVNKNYIQIWDTMINTIKLEKNMKMAVRILHLTNCKKIN